MPDVQSVHRCLDLLEAVARRGESGVTELATECGLNPSTAHNLLKTMTRRGYLLTVNGRYRLGPAMATITSRFDPVMALPAVVRPVIEAASRSTRINVLAAVLRGDQLQNIGWGGSSSLIYEVSRPRQEWDRETILEPAAGRVLVAMNRRDDWDWFIDAAPDAEPEWDHARWIDHLQEIVDTGLCVKFDPRRYLAIGVPVWAGQQVALCSLACALPASMSSPDLLLTVVDALWTATGAISASLGCPELPYPTPTPTTAQLEAVARTGTTP